MHTIKSILLNFLEQTKTASLETRHYPREFEGLRLKVGFGIGKVANIPWIAFLGDEQNPQNGIFPAFYFFKDQEKLILAYAISETEVPKKSWMLEKKETIDSYFRKSNITPYKYGSSYIYQVYDVGKSLDWNKIDRDLKNITTHYKTVLLKK